MQDLSGDGSATQGWNQQLHLHLHVSPCVPVWPMPPCFVCLHRPPMPFPAATGGKVLSPPSRPGDTLSRALQAQGHLPTILIPTPPSLLVLYSSSSSAEQAAPTEQTFLPQSHSNTSAVAPTAMPLSHHNAPPLQQGPPQLPIPSAITPNALADAFPPGLVVSLCHSGEEAGKDTTPLVFSRPVSPQAAPRAASGGSAGSCQLG